MAISTHLYAAHPDLALAPTIRSAPDVRVGVLSDAGTNRYREEYVFWIEADDFDALEASLASDHTVASFATVNEFADRRTYRLTYSEAAILLTPKIVEVGGFTSEARSHADGWILELQLPDHDALVALDEYADERDVHLEILDLQQNPDVANRINFGLTEAQAEALAAAYAHGYYEEPRESSLEDLADRLGISTAAAGGRLKRGAGRLVEATLVDEADRTGDEHG